MADGATTPSRGGQISSAGSVTALFLKKFAGEILTTFEENNVFKALHTVRTIDSGKSASFPVTGIATASYHTPGDNIADAGNSYLSDPKKNEQVITIDDVLLASTFLSSIDDVKNHYDIRSVYSTELGRALANRFDRAIAKCFIGAARTVTPGVTGGNVGGELDVSQNLLRAPAGAGSDADTTDPTGPELIAALFTAAAGLDNNDVPADGRFCVLRPQEYYKLITGGDGALVVATSASNKDIGGSGSLASGTIPSVAGISIYKSTHVPSTNMASSGGSSSGDEGASNDLFAAGDGYDGDFSNTCGIGAHPCAVGTVKLLDLATEAEYQIERQGTLFVAKYAMGHGVLRPECAIELHK